MNLLLPLLYTSLLRKVRDPVSFGLSLLTAPAFVAFYALVFQTATPAPTASIELLTCPPTPPTQDLFTTLERATQDDRSPIRTITHITPCDDLLETLRQNPTDRAALSIDTQDTRAPAVMLTADATAPTYPPLVLWLQTTLLHNPTAQPEAPPKPQLSLQPLGLSSDLRPFDTYVPSLLVFAVLMLIFSSSLTASRELESGTFRRLLHTPLHPAIFFLCAAWIELLIGSVALALTFLTAWLFGFQHSGSLWAAFLFACPAMLSCVGLGLLCATCTRTTSQAFLLSSVVMFVLLLFSGLLFPRPSVPLFTLFDTPVDALDILPTTPLITAWRHILILNTPPTALLYELTLLAVLALTLSTLGPLLFQWRTSHTRTL